jgi:hypothetical protein
MELRNPASGWEQSEQDYNSRCECEYRGIAINTDNVMVLGFALQNKNFVSLYEKYTGYPQSDIKVNAAPNFQIYSQYKKLDGTWDFSFAIDRCSIKKHKP